VTAVLTCSILGNDEVQEVTTSFDVTIPVQCGLGNSMTIPAISNYVITQNFVTTYIDAFPD
jgi:hypothetical protein